MHMHALWIGQGHLHFLSLFFKGGPRLFLHKMFIRVRNHTLSPLDLISLVQHALFFGLHRSIRSTRWLLLIFLVLVHLGLYTLGKWVGRAVECSRASAGWLFCTRHSR